ncbi:MAG: PadR family transcriptional regulator [Actinomycetota bacterium]
MNRTNTKMMKKMQMMQLYRELGAMQASHGFGGPVDDADRGPRGRRRGGPGRGPGPGRRRGGGHRRPRVSRGEVRLGILAVLAEEPMHGYQIMQEMEERSGGAWQPSPGSIYPTLQQLADEGLVVSEAVEGKNVFSLTEDGATVLAQSDAAPPWERFGEGHAAYGSLRRSIHQLGAAARQVAMAGSPAQVEEANRILTDARKSIYRLLAQDDAAI